MSWTLLFDVDSLVISGGLALLRDPQRDEATTTFETLQLGILRTEMSAVMQARFN